MSRFTLAVLDNKLLLGDLSLPTGLGQALNVPLSTELTLCYETGNQWIDALPSAKATRRDVFWRRTKMERLTRAPPVQTKRPYGPPTRERQQPRAKIIPPPYAPRIECRTIISPITLPKDAGTVSESYQPPATSEMDLTHSAHPKLSRQLGLDTALSSSSYGLKVQFKRSFVRSRSVPYCASPRQTHQISCFSPRRPLQKTVKATYRQRSCSPEKAAPTSQVLAPHSEHSPSLFGRKQAPAVFRLHCRGSRRKATATPAQPNRHTHANEPHLPSCDLPPVSRFSAPTDHPRGSGQRKAASKAQRKAVATL